MELTNRQIKFFEEEKAKHEKALANIDDRIKDVLSQFEDERKAEIEAIKTYQQVIDNAEPVEVGQFQAVETENSAEVNEIVDDAVFCVGGQNA